MAAKEAWGVNRSEGVCMCVCVCGGGGGRGRGGSQQTDAGRGRRDKGYRELEGL